MKKLIVSAIVFFSASVYAAEAIDFFGFIFNIIENEVNKDKPGNANSNKKVILKETENKIVLGRVFLTPKDGDDKVNLPGCVNKGPGNKRVTRLRLVISNNDVYVNQMRVTFGNGNTRIIQVNRGFNEGQTSKWYNLPGANERCVRAVRVIGDVDAKSGISFNFGTGGASVTSNFNHRAVVNIVGLKQ